MNAPGATPPKPRAVAEWRHVTNIFCIDGHHIPRGLIPLPAGAIPCPGKDGVRCPHYVYVLACNAVMLAYAAHATYKQVKAIADGDLPPLDALGFLGVRDGGVTTDLHTTD